MIKNWPPNFASKVILQLQSCSNSNQVAAKL